MKFRGLLLSLAMLTGVGSAQSLHCNLQDYKAMDGLKAEASGSTLIHDLAGRRRAAAPGPFYAAQRPAGS